MATATAPAAPAADAAAAHPLTLQRMEVIDLPEVTRLQHASVAASEAVPRDVIDYLVTFANNLSYIAVSDAGALLGYVVGAGAPTGTIALSRDALNNHCAGDVLVIRSVVVAPSVRRQGVGSALLAAYLAKIRHTTPMKRVLALVPAPVVPFYARAGFADLGPASDDTHHLLSTDL